jgi:hypothetical protein
VRASAEDKRGLKALGLTVLPVLLVRADEVVE